MRIAVAIACLASVGCSQAAEPIVGTWQFGTIEQTITYKPDGTCDQHWPGAPACTWRKLGEGRYELVIGGTKTMPMHMEGDELVFDRAPSPDAPPAHYHRVGN